MLKILCLGNEFIEEDSLAKKIGEKLKDKFNVVNVRDSFQLMSLLNENRKEEIVILDVVKNLKETQVIRTDDLRVGSILSAHDFDAGFVLKLIGKNFRIIGIPQRGNEEEISKEVLELLG